MAHAQGTCYDPTPAKCNGGMQCGVTGLSCDIDHACNHHGCCEDCRCDAAPACKEGYEADREDACTAAEVESGVCVLESKCCNKLMCRKVCGPYTAATPCKEGQCYNAGSCGCQEKETANCFVDPCQFASCSAGFVCVANYCGGCDHRCERVVEGACHADSDCAQDETCRKTALPGVDTTGTNPTCGDVKSCVKKGAIGDVCGAWHCDANFCAEGLACSAIASLRGVCYDPQPARCFGAQQCDNDRLQCFGTTQCNHRGCCEDCACKATPTCPSGYEPDMKGECTPGALACGQCVKESRCCTELTCKKTCTFPCEALPTCPRGSIKVDPSICSQTMWDERTCTSHTTCCQTISCFHYRR